MADIKAADVQKLRKATGAGMMDCKKALAATGGDHEKAMDELRKQYGFSDLLEKPFTQADVETLLAPYLGEERDERSAEHDVGYLTDGGEREPPLDVVLPEGYEVLGMSGGERLAGKSQIPASPADLILGLRQQRPRRVEVGEAVLGARFGPWSELIEGGLVEQHDGTLKVTLDPYALCWLGTIGAEA